MVAVLPSTARTPPRPPPVERVSGGLADPTRQLVRDAALLLLLLLLSKLDLLSVTRVDGLSESPRVLSWISGDGEICKNGVSSLMDSSVTVCTAIQYSVLAGTTVVKLLS